MPAPSEIVIAQLAPTGVLRAAINMSNFLLVTSKAENGDPAGVSPDLAAEIARRLGVEVSYRPYPSPGVLADAVAEWDIGNIGAEPQRAEHIAFTTAYCEIEATYLVPAGSPLKRVEDVDAPGNRIAVMGRAAYGLWLENNLKHAELVRGDTMDAALEMFQAQGLEALAALRPRLNTDREAMPGARILDGKFSAVQQGVGTPIANAEAAVWLQEFVDEAKASGLIADLIAKHHVQGLSVA